MRGFDHRRVRLGRRDRVVGDISLRRLVGGDVADALDVDRRKFHRVAHACLARRAAAHHDGRIARETEGESGRFEKPAEAVLCAHLAEQPAGL